MNKKILTALIAVSVVGIATVSANSVFAYRGDPNIQGPNYTAERHEAMEKAFDNNDYNAWKEQMQGRGRVTQVVNAENFAKFAEAHKLAEEGKLDEAQKIRQELGLGGNGGGASKGMRGNCQRTN